MSQQPSFLSVPAIAERPSPARTVGVIGGGQLAWMMATEAKALGIDLWVQTPQATDPAVAIATGAILAPLSDREATDQLAQHCQVVTFENEFVDLVALETLATRGTCFRPSLQTLAPLLDKYTQRSYLQAIGLPVPAFALITPETALQTLGFEFPIVVKARRHGYDGQGTFVIHTPDDLKQFWQRVGQQGDWLVEAFVPFERELAVIAARSLTGEILLFPIAETHQEQQVCHWVLAPADLTPQINNQIEAIAHRLLEELQAIGVFGIELFLTGTGEVLVNEIAPRTHNSGHFTLDACVTSQFEQHLRAVCGLPLGSPALHHPAAVMVNLLGFEQGEKDYWDCRQQLAHLPNTYVHWYGKTKAYPGRKLGHVTALLANPDRASAIAAITQIEKIWYKG